MSELMVDEIARMMTDPATCDVLSEDWLKDSIDSLLAEVRALRSENAKLRKLTTTDFRANHASRHAEALEFLATKKTRSFISDGGGT